MKALTLKSSAASELPNNVVDSNKKYNRKKKFVGTLYLNPGNGNGDFPKDLKRLKKRGENI